MMRICLSTDTYLPEINGVTTVLAQMRDGLRGRGHEVLVLAPRYDRPSADEDGVRRLAAIPAPAYPQVRLSWPWGRGLARLLDGFRPQLVHCVTEGPLGLFGRGYARRRAVPTVSSFHTDFPRYAARYLGPLAVKPTRAYLRWFHRVAAFTQTPSEVTRDELFAMGVPRATVWGRGVATSLFRPDRRSEARRRAMGVSEGGMLVLHVGRLAVEKDVDTLVASFTLARDRLGQGSVFCVAGDGPRAASVRAALPWARHLGFLGRGVLADLYSDADLFVFPSATETCGLVALEALASGVPVIGADQGGVRENLREGLTGLIVPAGQAHRFADAIVRLALDREQRGAMSEAARAFAVGRDWARELDALEQAYARLTAASTAAVAPSIWPTTTSVT
jgi:phosphatidylinositol alpha 1,6-mannosyltransferase